ncbi:hypothetical protein N7481_006998 [Penicillium waksmanii]|uniref:uncharacterized protein n=1 Tax=Penicillium waksmanii TaxID=69791 RepID=UPI002546C2C6|nr:uncharacterized protein N7481_006998 [Penicillium waksmanii]KAJ5979700.1 hypothetical protein N7481_006998 [Penicillium waksmanii]
MLRFLRWEVMFEEVFEQWTRLRSFLFESGDSTAASVHDVSAGGRSGSNWKSDILRILGLGNNVKAVKTPRISTTTYPANDGADAEELDRKNYHGSGRGNRNPKP